MRHLAAVYEAVAVVAGRRFGGGPGVSEDFLL
jgi:hypothetical protein